jgi:hypothetical protein
MLTVRAALQTIDSSFENGARIGIPEMSGERAPEGKY